MSVVTVAQISAWKCTKRRLVWPPGPAEGAYSTLPDLAGFIGCGQRQGKGKGKDRRDGTDEGGDRGRREGTGGEEGQEGEERYKRGGEVEGEGRNLAPTSFQKLGTCAMWNPLLLPLIGVNVYHHTFNSEATIMAPELISGLCGLLSRFSFMYATDSPLGSWPTYWCTTSGPTSFVARA